MQSIHINWIGTAGFIIKFEGQTISFDPFLSRHDPEHPSKIVPKDFDDVDEIFLGHGHFDHVFDIPDICAVCPRVTIHSGRKTAEQLIQLGVDPSRVQTVNLDNPQNSLSNKIKIYPFESKHVHFDRALIGSTFQRCGLRLIRLLPLLINYPVGEVVTYLLSYADRKILFISSAGCSKDELSIYNKLGINILLFPVQGHSNITDLAFKMIKMIEPEVVIPHHHDNFYSPLSQNINVYPLKESIEQSSLNTSFLELKMFEEAQI